MAIMFMVIIQKIMMHGNHLENTSTIGKIIMETGANQEKGVKTRAEEDLQPFYPKMNKPI